MRAVVQFDCITTKRRFMRFGVSGRSSKPPTSAGTYAFLSPLHSSNRRKRPVPVPISAELYRQHRPRLTAPSADCLARCP
jgi:hypothetical protein